MKKWDFATLQLALSSYQEVLQLNFEFINDKG